MVTLHDGHTDPADASESGTERSGAGCSCPSYFCRPGATLLGIVLPDGRIAYSSKTIVIDEAFVRTAKQGRAPEARFRFAGPCVRGACTQWNGSACGLAVRLMDDARASGAFEGGAPVDAIDLPGCTIRGSCRWRREHGDRACVVCPWVIYQQAEEQSAGGALVPEPLDHPA